MFGSDVHHTGRHAPVYRPCRFLDLDREQEALTENAIPQHPARHSTKVRKWVESIFGWMKTVGRSRRSRYVELERTGLCGVLVATACNLVRMSRLIVEREAGAPVFS